MDEEDIYDAVAQFRKDHPEPEFCRHGYPAATCDFCEELSQLRQQVAELKSKNAGSLANNLCQDCRDKQVGQPCLGCTIQKLRRQVAEGQAAFQKVLNILNDAGAEGDYEPDLISDVNQIMAMKFDNSALISALAAERERCAKVAEISGRPVGCSDGNTYILGTCRDAARAIRALSTDGGSNVLV